MKTEVRVEYDLAPAGTDSTKRKLDITEFTGGDKLWQRSIFLIIFLMNVPVGYHTLSVSFLAPNLDHWCARPPEFFNISADDWRILAIPPDDPQCSRLV